MPSGMRRAVEMLAVLSVTATGLCPTIASPRTIGLTAPPQTVITVTSPAHGQTVVSRPSSHVQISGTVAHVPSHAYVSITYSESPTETTGETIQAQIPIVNGTWHYRWDTDQLLSGRYYLNANVFTTVSNMGYASAQGGAVHVVGPWAPELSLPQPRQELGAAFASDGRVYAIGGYVQTRQTENGRSVIANDVAPSALAWRPGSAGWASAAPLPAPRADAAVATLPDGRILVTGGVSDGGNAPHDSVYLFDARTGRWSARASIPDGRAHAAAVAGADGRVYVVGGYTSHAYAHVPTEVYDPRANRWSALPAPPDAPQDPAAVRAGDGRIFMLGGTSTATKSATVSPAVYSYNPRTRHWATLAPLHTPRAQLGATTDRAGRVIAFGGYLGNGEESEALELYDPRTNLWRTQAGVAYVGYGYGVARTPDGVTYLVGGGGNDAFRTVYRYDPSVR